MKESFLQKPEVWNLCQVTIAPGGAWTIVQGLQQDDFATEKMVATYNELQEEAAAAADLAAAAN